MNEMRDSTAATLTDLPSFGKPPKISGSDHIAAVGKTDNDAVDDGGGVEFAFAIREPVPNLPIAADEIFDGGKFCPLYSVNRSLRLTETSAVVKEKPKRPRLIQFLIQEHEYMKSHSSDNELEGVSPGSYCLWSPELAGGPPERVEKTCTDWLFRRLIRDLGRGKERVVFLAAAEKKRAPKNRFDKKKGGNEKKREDGERRARNGYDRSSLALLRPEWSCSLPELSCRRPEFSSRQS